MEINKNFIGKDLKIDHINNKMYTEVKIPYNSISSIEVERLKDSEVTRRGLSNKYKHYCYLTIITPDDVVKITVPELDELGTIVNEFCHSCTYTTIEKHINHENLITFLDSTHDESTPRIEFLDIESFESSEVKSFTTTDGVLDCSIFFNVVLKYNNKESTNIVLPENDYLSFIKHYSLYKKYQHQLLERISHPHYFDFDTFISYEHIDSYTFETITDDKLVTNHKLNVKFKNNQNNLNIILKDDSLECFKKGYTEWLNYINSIYQKEEA